MKRIPSLLLAAFAGVAAASFPQQAPTATTGRALSLAEALELADKASETVRVAEAEVKRTEAQKVAARSERFPQLDGSSSYTRTLHSEFQDIDLDFGGGDGGSSSLSDLPFGQRNQYRLGLVVNQSLWSGGRITAQARAASAAVDSAWAGLAAARAELELTVTQAYFDALLLDRLVDISEQTLQQADRAYEQTKLANQVGNQSEFELLRAQVSRDNVRPALVQRRADRDLAYARLAQLLDLPTDGPLQLTTSFADFATWDAKGSAPAAADRAAWLQKITDDRVPVRQALAAVEVQKQQVKIAHAERLPSVGASSDYGRVAYPIGGLPAWADTRTNWTVGLGLRVPLLTGGRLAAQEGAAMATLDEAKARFDQTREAAGLDARDALDRLAAADAVFQAAFGTIAQAQRAYEIAELRYREGISTQLELNDTRIQLTFAQGNAALAARNLQVARARVALLPDLPLGAGANATLTAAGAGVSAPIPTAPTAVVSPAGF